MFRVQQQYYFLLALSGVICAVFMWVGARLARVHRANLLKAILAAIMSMVVSWAFRTALSAALPVAGPIFGFLLGFLLALLIVKAVFNTSLVRAVVVWFFFLLSQPVIAFFVGRSFFRRSEHLFLERVAFLRGAIVPWV